MRLVNVCAGGVGLFLVVAMTRCGSGPSKFGPGDGGDGDGANTDGPVFTPGDGSKTDAPVVVDKCHVPPDNQAGDAPNCTTPAAPPNSFSPVLKWKWEDPDTNSIGVWVIPLVANMTDDDNNGEVNLCDIPDVIVETAGGGEFSRSGKLYMLGGKDGHVESTFGGTTVDGDATPALADLDGDKVPEVIAVNQAGNIVIFDNDGRDQIHGRRRDCASTDEYARRAARSPFTISTATARPRSFTASRSSTTTARPSGSVTNAGPGFWCPTPIAADLDGDGKLEVIFGNAHITRTARRIGRIRGVPGAPQVANLDSDPLPEILIARQDGIIVLENDGTMKFGPVQPFDPGVSPNCWDKPAAIHDFDGDGIADLATSSCKHVRHLPPDRERPHATVVEARRRHERHRGEHGLRLPRTRHRRRRLRRSSLALVYDGKTGSIELTQVALVGHDHRISDRRRRRQRRSADILVVSNDGSYPALQVFEDAAKTLDSDAPHLEPARVSRDERARRRHHPRADGRQLEAPQHVPHELGNPKRRRLRPAAAEPALIRRATSQSRTWRGNRSGRSSRRCRRALRLL